MFSRTVRRLLVILGLAIVFYFLVSMTIARMPFTSQPFWWMSIWPSRKIGVYAWFGLLNAAGALMAAVPVALLLSWLIDRNRARGSVHCRGYDCSRRNWARSCGILALWSRVCSHDI